MRNQISHRDITFKNKNLEMFSKASTGLRFRTRKCCAHQLSLKLKEIFRLYLQQAQRGLNQSGMTGQQANAQRMMRPVMGNNIGLRHLLQQVSHGE